jgi:hypothetical protein
MATRIPTYEESMKESGFRSLASKVTLSCSSSGLNMLPKTIALRVRYSTREVIVVGGRVLHAELEVYRECGGDPDKVCARMSRYVI